MFNGSRALLVIAPGWPAVARHSSSRRCDTHFEHAWDRNYRLDGDSSVNMMASALPGASHQAMALAVTDGEHPTSWLTVRGCRSPIRAAGLPAARIGEARRSTFPACSRELIRHSERHRLLGLRSRVRV